MNKIIISIFLLSVVLLLSSCFDDKNAVNNAKKELGIIKNNLTDEEINNEKEKPEDIKTENIEKEKPEEFKSFEIESLSMNTFIELDDLSGKDFTTGEIEISGKTLLDVDKIEVSFSNKSSEYPDDKYLLKQFKAGDPTFVYRAFSRYQTLDYGKNEYIFTAYSSSDTSKIKLTINLKTPDELKEEKNNDAMNKEENTQKIVNEKIIYEKKKFGGDDEVVYLNFPKSDLFGEMISTGENSFTYSNISGLNVSKKDISNITCENITDSLSDSIGGWFYWNTCRNIIKEKGIKFNVLRLSGDKYFYERHYVDYNNSLYGVFLIEKGVGVNPDNIKEKNSTLKEKDFDNTKVVDELFYEIVR